MQIFNSIEEFTSVKIFHNQQNFSASVGNFDGVHLGHQQIFRVLYENSQTLKQTNLIITFYPHPKVFFKSQTTNFSLNTLDEKIKNIRRLNYIDNLLIINFDSLIQNMEPEEFVEQTLIDKLKINQLILGSNFHFGRNQRGNIELLKKYFSNNLIIPNLLHYNNQIISSSTIKNLIQNGNIKQANQLLGYNYFIEDFVRHGNQLARKLGFPTANIINTEKILPRFGVYSVLVTLENNKILKGIANIGIKPTVGLATLPILEVHILNFHDDIYNQKIKVEFLDFIREEKKFPNLDELVKQIENDIQFI